MRPRLPLRWRFALLAMLLGLLLSGLAALVLLRAAYEDEYIVSREILRGQAEDYGRRLAQGQSVQLPQTQRLRGYRLQDPALPRAYAGYPLGVHEDPVDSDIHVGVFDTAAGRLLFVIDLGDIEAMERHLRLLMGLIIGLGALLSGWLGWIFSGIALRPLQALARAVDALPAQPQPTRLADALSHDALGRLADAIDRYQARLVEADAREQAFLADASHELRTPLAVVQGALDVLQDDPAATPAQQARLARLARGAADMRRLLEAMLSAARRKPLRGERVAAEELLRRAADAALAGRPGPPLEIQAAGELEAAPAEALLLLAGVLRMLAQADGDGVLRLHWRAPCFLLQREAAASSTAVRADTGTGSALLDRLAQRLGWQVRWEDARRVVVVTGPG
ncbi:MAG: HAMP domain-containing sensor histidine kinase [Pseudomonadota bacterium]|uniref:sensor histidine kinase n=1 Tax=Thermomonas sp. S9 TaxID=2885203 RepID=UPI00286FD979|nr:HAMP domain-containing sensor histidine kinase [Thermomonas sp. S9]